MQFCRSDLLRCPAPTSSRLPSTALLSFVNRLVIFEHPSLCLSSEWCNVTSGFFPSFDKYFSRVRSVPDAVAGTLYRGASSLTTWALSRACWLSPAPSSWPNWVATGVPAGPTDPPCPRAWWGWFISSVPGHGGCGGSRSRGQARGFRQCASARRSCA